MTRALLGCLLAFAATCVSAQGKMVPASEAQFTGYWRIILIPDEIHKSSIKNASTGYDHPCQFFVHEAGGAWRSVTIGDPAGAEETKAACPVKKSQLAAAL